MNNKTYFTQAIKKYNIFKNKNKLTIIYSPLGSGKTYWLKKQIAKQKNKITIIAPYLTCRTDLELTKPDMESLNQPFLYTNYLIKIFSKSDKFINISHIKNRNIKKTHKYINKVLSKTFKNKHYFILDEIDFMFIQARREFITSIDDNDNKLSIHGDWFFTQVLTCLIKFKNTTVIGITATKHERFGNTLNGIGIPSKLIKEIYLKKATTTVTIKKFTNYISNTQFKSVDKLNHALSLYIEDKKPTLIFKQVYTTEDYQAMLDFSKEHNIPILVILRHDNAKYQRKDKQSYYECLLEKDGNKLVMSDKPNNTLRAGKLYWYLVDDKATSVILDTFDKGIVPIVLINLSSSRQYSIINKNKKIKSARVITVSKMNGSSLQVFGRFRNLPLEVVNYFTSAQIHLDKYIGNNFINQLNIHLPLASSYAKKGKVKIVTEWLVAETKGKNVGKAIGKNVGKSISKATIRKRNRIYKCKTRHLQYTDYVDNCIEHNEPYVSRNGYSQASQLKWFKKLLKE